MAMTRLERKLTDSELLKKELFNSVQPNLYVVVGEIELTGADITKLIERIGNGTI